jgi:hypothetical protein
MRALVNVSIVDLSGPGADPETLYVAFWSQVVNRRTTV